MKEWLGNNLQGEMGRGISLGYNSPGGNSPSAIVLV